jgi:hypothetical protein
MVGTHRITNNIAANSHHVKHFGRLQQWLREAFYGGRVEVARTHWQETCTAIGVIWKDWNPLGHSATVHATGIFGDI